MPGSSVGNQYIDLLNDEIHYLSLGTYPSEYAIVFCSTMLQRDRLVQKGCDICCLLECCMTLWPDGKFDVQEAIRCDQSFCNSSYWLEYLLS